MERQERPGERVVLVRESVAVLLSEMEPFVEEGRRGDVVATERASREAEEAHVASVWKRARGGTRA